MRMNKGIESESASPAVREIFNLHARITGGLSLAPQQKRVFRWSFLRILCILVLELSHYRYISFIFFKLRQYSRLLKIIRC